MSDNTGRHLFRSWLDNLDTELQAKAARAAQSKHPTMIGDHREMAFREALAEFLPASVSIGKGKVISSTSESSRQSDVVLFDARFPRLKQGDSWLFPVEGVLATIELKSSLGLRDLCDAWRNCLSVLEIAPTIVQEDFDEQIQAFERRGLSHNQAVIKIDRMLRPKSYVFGFSGSEVLTTRGDILMSALGENGVAVFAEESFVCPSLVCAGGVISAAWGDPLRIPPLGGQAVDETTIVMQSFRSDHGFGLMASHLLWHIERRISLTTTARTVRQSVLNYLPFEEYVNPFISGKPVLLTLSPGDSSMRPSPR